MVSITSATGAPFFAIEIEAFQPAGTALPLPQAWNATPYNSLSLTSFGIASTATIRASDVGYRTRATDPSGVVPYPALLAEAFQISSAVPIDPTQVAAGAGWGEAIISNDDGRFDGIVASMNSDGRTVSVLRGTKAWDDARGIFVDPAYADLVPMFVGIAQPWHLDETSLRIPLRDATYWLERPYQESTYGGTGTYDGTAALIGKRIPRTRGGTAGHPVKNVTPVLVDDGALIYQYNDAAGTVVTLFEGAKSTYTADGDVANLYSGSVSSGHYRTDNSRGLLQLGSTPAHTITLDVTGEFPVAGAVTIAASIARYLMTEDLALPSGNIDTTSFSNAATDFPYVAGLYFGPDNASDGVAAASAALAAFGARLIPDAAGKLKCFVLRALAGTETPDIEITIHNCVSLKVVPMPTTLDPPPYRVRVAWQHNYTVQASDINVTATASQIQFAAAPDTYAAFISAGVSAQYAKPNDVGPFGGALLVQTDAQSVADAVGALFAKRTRMFDAVMPVTEAMGRDIGDVARVIYPVDDLRNGRLGQIIGRQYNSGDPTITLRVLV